MFNSSNGDFDIKKEHINNKGEYVVTSGLANNGILGKSDVKARVFNENTITVDMFGNAFYRNHKYKIVTHARVFTLIPKDEITKNIGLFLSNSLHFLKHKFAYENMCSWAKIKDEKIQLPVKNGKINFSFIEKFIAELEAEHLAELEAYLKVTNLEDYTLSDKETRVLEEFSTISWKEFEIKELFEIKNTLSFNKDKLTSGSEYDYITRTSQNQGILQETGFVNEENINEAGTWSLGLLQMDFFYRNKPWYAGQFVRKIVPKIDLSKNSILYFSTLLNQQKNVLLSVLVRDVDKIFLNSKIHLPVKNKKIDFDMMNTFISAIQKLVIKDVVLYANRKIAITQTIIK